MEVAHLVTLPSSTYRLQISAGFTLVDAARTVPYLQALGIGAVYVSPLLRAVDGSEHGYDVVDHGLVDPARGGASGLAALGRACQKAGMGLVVDIVPNHMGVADPVQNRPWWAMLEHGPDAPTAAWFDVDWEHGGGKVSLPVLDGELDPGLLSFDPAGLRYGAVRLPLAPGSRGPDDPPLEVLARQHYRLIPGGDPHARLNYRRFFAVSDLAGLRVEVPEVYRDAHREVLRWLDQYGVTGLRIDHPDGLARPTAYLDRLADDAPDAWITVEKITRPGETLPEEWPVAGTTGYDALAEVNALMVDPGAEPEFDRAYRQLTGDTTPWADHAHRAKEQVLATLFRPEVGRLARLIGAGPPVADGLCALAAALPVYRTYLPTGRHHLDQAVGRVRRTRPELGPALDLLLPRLTDPADEVCVRFQQLTGAAMAKGVEDTAFYRYTRLVSLNEVGGDPGTFGSSVEDFHRAQVDRLAHSPCGMTALSTHDTKRGEDVRARMAVLPELTTQWVDTAERLMALAPIPYAPLAYHLWQTLVATGLIDRDRMHAFAEKAMREGAVGTSWSRPDQRFEGLVHGAVDAAYDHPEVRGVVESFAARLEHYGRSNSLSQKLIQLTMPGVPDVYQGSEMAEDSLVDPDNRRPVDFDTLTAALGSLGGPGRPTGASAKLWITHRALSARRDRPDLFTGYRPLPVGGLGARHLVAYDRGGAVTLATRLPRGLEHAGGWSDLRVELPPGQFRDALTGRAHHGEARIGTVLSDYPVALLLAEVRA